MSHPISEGIVAAWLFNEQGVGGLSQTRQLEDSATKAWPCSVTLTAGDILRGYSDIGVGISLPGNVNAYLTPGALPLDSSHWTIICRLTRPTASAASVSFRYVAWGGGGPTIWSAGSGNFGIVHTGTVDLSASEGPPAGGVPHVLAITRSNARARMYRDARKIASSDAFAVSYSQDSDFRIGSSTAFGEPVPGVFDYVYAWRRGLTESEITELFLNPYGHYTAPRSARMFFGFAAAGGGGFQAAWAVGANQRGRIFA